MSVRTRMLFVTLMAPLLMLAALSCSKIETAKIQAPPVTTEDNLNQARQLINDGYALLDSAKLEGAVAKFAEVDTLIPGSYAGGYNSAAAYALSGNKDKAIETLTSLVDRGFDRAQQLIDDTDFDSLRSDPRFDSLVTRAKANYAAASAVFASGMPEYATAPEKFSTEDSLVAWIDRQNRLLQMESRYWRSSDNVAARIDFAARRLACVRDLKIGDTTFDYGLERLRAASRMQSPYEPGWGSVSDLVLKEAENYLKAPHDAEKSSEANYLAGFALALKYSASDDQRLPTYQQAQVYLNKVTEGTGYYPAAQVILLVDQFRSPGANDMQLGSQLKSILEKYSGNTQMFRATATQFSNNVPKYIWPIPLDQRDIDGKNVALDEYKGKLLMIDFWATWCPPCRAELPNLLAVYKEYHPKGLEVLSVSLDYPQEISPDAYRKWIDSAGMNWRHIYDGANWGTELVRRFYIGSIPSPYLVGKDGSLVAMGEALRGDSLAITVKSALGL